MLHLGTVDPPAPRHAEVKDHRVVAIGMDQAIFRAAAEARHPGPRQTLAEILGEGSAQVGASRLDTRDPPALQHVAQGRGLSFQLREALASRRYGGVSATPLEPRPMSDNVSQKVSFGEELVSPEEKTRRVGEVFSSVARRYDVMNDLMSGGLHRLWKDRFVVRVKPRSGEQILDMAGGTGDIAFRMAQRGAHVTVSDINADMLAVGEERARKRGARRASNGKSRMPRR